MVETRWTSRGEKGLVVTLGLVGFARLACSRACPNACRRRLVELELSRRIGRNRSSGSQVAARATRPPRLRRAAAAASRGVTAAACGAAAPRPVESPPPTEPRFPVTVSSGGASVTIRGPGIEKPLTCSGTCAFTLWEGTYWFDVQASGRTWTEPVTVTEPEHVVIEKPNAGARGLGVAGIIVGGLTLSVAGFVSYSILLNCAPGGPNEGSAQCDSVEEALPYWLATVGIGAVVSARRHRCLRQQQQTFRRDPAGTRQPRAASAGDVHRSRCGPGSPLPGLSLQASF